MTAPTLLVGLGGTGSKIVCRVSGLVTEEQRKRIGFAVFDTDINELRDIREANPFIRTIQTSTKMSVGEYLNIDTHARDEWFPVNAILNSKTLTEGAGQVRAISRLALDTAIRAGNMDALHAAIEDLYKVEADHSDQALRVIIVSSLAGGTGSGLILPVALYIKNFLATRFQQSANIIRGFFILPEVFFEVIRGQSERNNLMCNAYATLRELDAFMMKGDGTLPEKYAHTVRLEFPRVGSTQFDEYNVRPYDFCFLFDAQNTDGRKLNDFNQYLDHAANCIYSQSIGPMNKRSNSSEDNTIRELCVERGRNRYAGAGCSMLIYPVDDVKEYVALKWTLETVSEQWLKFDRMYIDKCRENAKMRSQGLPVRDIDAAQDYIATVESRASQKDPFAVSIVDQCAVYDDDGLNRIAMQWDRYLKELTAYVQNYGMNQASLDAQREIATNHIDDISGGSDSWGDLQNAYFEVKKYYSMACKLCEASAPNLAYTIFKAQSDNVTKEKQNYQLETYLRNTEGEFIHPNAVRYFLYQCREQLKGAYNSYKNQYDTLDKYFKEFEKNSFDDPNTEDVVETVEQLTDRSVSLKAKLTKKLTDDQVDLKESYVVYLNKVDELKFVLLMRDVLKEGLEYVRVLCESFGNFYLTFDNKISLLNRRLGEIAKKYNQTSGKTTRYVCASSKCMNALVERIPYTGSAITIDGWLSDEIYSKVRAYALLGDNDRPDNGRYFSDLFDEGIIGYFKRKLMMTYGPQIDMDIITALEREVEFEQGEQDPSRHEQYVRQIIESTRKMSTPFIERPIGEQREPITACTFSPDIEPNDDSPRAGLIAKELRNYGGTPDSDIGRNMIMFYQSIYGLRANRLSKFAPAVEGMHGEGAYYKAYYELVGQIVPTRGNSPVITPHVDRSWHLTSYMPDLDEQDQKRIETRIYRAFVLGLLYKKIRQKKISEFRYLYKLELDGCLPEEFVISNKTPCDLFYEVLDALMINPVVVNRILSEVEREMARERNSNVSFERSRMLDNLRNFGVVEYEKKNSVRFRMERGDVTIFDLPALIRVSAPGEEFSIESGIDLMNVILDEVYNYMKSMESSELNDKYAAFIVSQYRRFTRNRLNFRDESGNLPYDEKIAFIDELKRVPRDRLRQMEQDEALDELVSIDREFEERPDLYIDNRDDIVDESPEINAIANAQYRDQPAQPQSQTDLQSIVNELAGGISQKDLSLDDLKSLLGRTLTSLSAMHAVKSDKSDN